MTSSSEGNDLCVHFGVEEEWEGVHTLTKVTGTLLSGGVGPKSPLILSLLLLQALLPAFPPCAQISKLVLSLFQELL